MLINAQRRTCAFIFLLLPHARHGDARPKEVMETSNYEIMLLVNPEVEAEGRAEILDRVRKIAADGKGSVDNVDEWGKKRLAYEINHFQDAFYYVITLTVTAAALNEITRILKITDGVLRFMPVALKETVTSES